MEIWTELEVQKNNLKIALKDLRVNGSNLAKAEHDYKIAVNKRVLEMRDKGMPATLINLIIYGEEDIAELRLVRDIAKTTYEANQEAINCTKLNIRLIESQMNREYTNTND